MARDSLVMREGTVQWDPDTAKDCVERYNNNDNESCEYVRHLFATTRINVAFRRG